MATKRPTYSSWSAIILLVGLAIVTCGGGGAACGCDWLCPMAASAGTSRSRIVSRRTDFNVDIRGIMDVGIKLIVWVLLLFGSATRQDRAAAVMMQLQRAGCAALPRARPSGAFPGRCRSLR